MSSRRLLPAFAAALLLAAPAATLAASDSAMSRAMIATMDLCFRVFQGQADWQAGLNTQNYVTTSTGGRVLPMGDGSIIAATIGSNTVGGASARICEITASPQISMQSELKTAMAARSGNLPAMGRGAISGGGVMDGYADLSRSGLAVLAITDRPAAASGGRATTSISVIWK